MNTPREIAERPALHHVSLKTTRPAAMAEWYRIVVGCVPTFTSPQVIFTTNDAANHRVAFITTPAVVDDPDKVAHAGMHHMAFEFSSLDALLANYTRLVAADIRPHLCLDHGLTMSFYYLDPDGNSVELQSDNFGDWAKSTEFMRTSPDFAENPIGIEVDPPQMVAARAAGATVAEILERSRAGAFAPEQPGDIRLPM